MSRDFRPGLFYNEPGDQLEVIWKDELGVAKWINQYLTLKLSIEDEKEVIGVIITNFRESFEHNGIRIDVDYEENPITDEERIELIEQFKSFGFNISKKKEENDK